MKQSEIMIPNKEIVGVIAQFNARGLINRPPSMNLDADHILEVNRRLAEGIEDITDIKGGRLRADADPRILEGIAIDALNPSVTSTDFKFDDYTGSFEFAKSKDTSAKHAAYLTLRVMAAQPFEALNQYTALVVASNLMETSGHKLDVGKVDKKLLQTLDGKVSPQAVNQLADEFKNNMVTIDVEVGRSREKTIDIPSTEPSAVQKPKASMSMGMGR